MIYANEDLAKYLYILYNATSSSFRQKEKNFSKES